MNKYLSISPEVQQALDEGRPVVALESTIISHGMPYPQNVETALKVEQTIRDNGAVPATIAVIGDKLKAGCTPEEIEYLGKRGQAVTKASRRDLPVLIARGEDGATTVTTTMIIAAMAGIKVPQDTKVILCQQDGVGKDYPFSIEKLSPLLAFYTEPDWQHACERCLELLRFGGIGHSLSIHTSNPELVRTFVMKKPVSRLLVNTGSTQGGIGATTGISPSFTLGCGAVGGSATSDNVTVHHLYQIRRAAYGLIEPEDVAKETGACSSCSAPAQNPQGGSVNSDEMERIVQAVLRQIRGIN